MLSDVCGLLFGMFMLCCLVGYCLCSMFVVVCGLLVFAVVVFTCDIWFVGCYFAGYLLVAFCLVWFDFCVSWCLAVWFLLGFVVDCLFKFIV